MNWSKAKTIFILSFMILNLFLGVQVWKDRESQSIQGQLSPFLVDDIKRNLQLANIVLQEEVPTEAPEMGYVSVSSKAFTAQDFSAIPKQSISWDSANDEAQVRLLQPVPLSYSMDIDDWDNIIKPYVLFFDKYQYDRYLSTQDKMVFTQMIGTYPIFSTQLSLDLGTEGWTEYKQRNVEVVSQGKSRKVISAYTALQVLLENKLLQEEEVVKKINLGYYSEGYTTDENPLAPVWRISHTTGIHYVNGITGAMMGNEIE